MDPNVGKPADYYPNPPPVYPGDDTRYPPIIPLIPYFGRQPLQVTCANCGQVVLTNVVPVTGACALISALVIFLVCFPFFWVPLVIDTCKDFQHVCPSCNVVLGVYKKL